MDKDVNVRVETYCPVVPIPSLPTALKRDVQSDEDAPPPVIIHVRCDSVAAQHHNKPLFEFLADHTIVTRTLLHDLFEFGAIYARIGVRTPQQSPRPPRATKNMTLLSGAALYARIHASPKRHFPRFGSRLRVLHDDGELVIVNKPAGLPVCATADNALECVTYIASAHVTHRLDVATCGVLAMAKSIDVVPRVNQALLHAQKRYCVLSRAPPPIGRLQHWVAKRAYRGRGIVSEPLIARWNEGKAPSQTGWVPASLVVDSVDQICIEDETLWESRVFLETGRTHQIRLQFAAIGCSVWRDTKYQMGEAKLLSHDPDSADVLRLGADPSVLGLCAAELRLPWNGDVLVFHSDPPWWKNR